MAITEKYVSSAGAGAHDGSSEANAFSFTEMVTDINAGGKAGNRYNVKADATYTRTGTVDTLTGDGTSTAPVIIRGYNSVIGDGFLGRSNGNAALISTNMPLISYGGGQMAASGADWVIWESLNITGTRNGPTLNVGANCVTKSNKLANTGTGASSQALNNGGANCIVFDNDIEFAGVSGGLSALGPGSSGRIICNRITGGTAPAISGASAHSYLFNLIYNSTGIGITQTTLATISVFFGNTISGCSGDAIDIITGTTNLQCIISNILADNGGYGIDGNNAAVAIFAAYNRTRDNSSGADNLATDWLASTRYAHIITDTGGVETDFTNAAAGDYSLISASPAKGAGNWPYLDIGALQRQEVSAGIMISQGMNGGFNG